jgi:hypothetical protein
MAEDWQAIAAEISAAISSVGFAAQLIKTPIAAATPWDDQIDAETASTITVVDGGFRAVYGPGMVDRQAHMLTVSTAGATPAIGDIIQIGATRHQVVRVEPLAPGGVDLLFDVEVEA